LSDTHTIDWSQSDNILVPNEGYVGDTFTFDPATLEAGIYTLRVAVTDNGTPSETANAELMLRVFTSAPQLSGSSDSDGDGVDDLSEGYADADNDGIPDFLDAIADSHVQQASGEDPTQYLMQAPAGLSVSIGHIAFASERTSTSVSAQDIADHGGPDGGVASAPEDDGYAYPVGMYDFRIDGLPQAGQSVDVVVALQGAVPEDAVYRRYDRRTGWQPFEEDDKNQVSSAPGALGSCPPPGDSAYVAGLTAGHYCVQLTIEDGGPNDADGGINASISDPSGVAVLTEPAATPTAPAGDGSSGGCSLNAGGERDLFFYLLVAVSLIYLAFGRRHRLNR
jgi:hypothetical protein